MIRYNYGKLNDQHQFLCQPTNPRGGGGGGGGEGSFCRVINQNSRVAVLLPAPLKTTMGLKSACSFPVGNLRNNAKKSLDDRHLD